MPKKNESDNEQTAVTVGGTNFPRDDAEVFTPVGATEAGWVPAGDWWGHAMSYKEAADFLVSQVSNGTFETDSITPIIFLYRHYLELALKALAHQIYKRQSAKSGKPDHKLLELWKYVTSACRFDLKAEGLVGASAIIGQWSKWDYTSTTFRYPSDLNGKPSLPETFPLNINLEVLGEQMAAIDRVFRAIDNHIYYRMSS